MAYEGQLLIIGLVRNNPGKRGKSRPRDREAGIVGKEQNFLGIRKVALVLGDGRAGDR